MDPTALSRREMKKLAADPGASAATLLALADVFPELVLANPQLAMIAMEDPAAWQKIFVRAWKMARLQRVLPRAKGTLQANRHALLERFEHCLEHYQKASLEELKRDRPGAMVYLDDLEGAAWVQVLSLRAKSWYFGLHDARVLVFLIHPPVTDEASQRAPLEIWLASESEWGCRVGTLPDSGWPPKLDQD